MASHKLFIFLLLSLIILFYITCSSSKDPDRYIGFWQEPSDDLAVPTEIKQQKGRLYIIIDVDGEQTELPATFNEEGTSLHAKLPVKSGNLIDVQAIYLKESKRLQMNIAGLSNELSKISEAEANKRKKRSRNSTTQAFSLANGWI